MTPSQTTSIVEKLSEPYATLALFLAVTGLRIGEAIAIKSLDFDGDFLHVLRRMYDGKIDTTKNQDSEWRIPIRSALLERMKSLDKTGEWAFHGRLGVPVNPCNAMKRHIRPVAKEVKIELSGWRDFHHTGNITITLAMVLKVVSQLLGHRCRDHASDLRSRGIDAFRAPLNQARQTNCYERCYETGFVEKPPL